MTHEFPTNRFNFAASTALHGAKLQSFDIDFGIILAVTEILPEPPSINATAVGYHR